MAPPPKFGKGQAKARQLVPARSKVKVNKTIAKANELEAKAAAVEVKQFAENEKLDEIFDKNLEIALSLLPTVIHKHSAIVHEWINKLVSPGIPKSKRNAHLQYLIFQMQTMKIAAPFDMSPPENIAEANKILNPGKMTAMMKEMGAKHLKEIMREGLTPHGIPNFRGEYKCPAEFFFDHPIPKNGLIAYGGCFSNHFE